MLAIMCDLHRPQQRAWPVARAQQVLVRRKMHSFTFCLISCAVMKALCENKDNISGALAICQIMLSAIYVLI